MNRRVGTKDNTKKMLQVWLITYYTQYSYDKRFGGGAGYCFDNFYSSKTYYVILFNI